MSPQEAISVMEPLEERFHVLKWRAHRQQARLTSSDDTHCFEVIEPYDYRSEVTFDLLGGRYLVRVRHGAPVKVTYDDEPEGAASSVWVTKEESFDGNVYRRMESYKPATPKTPADNTTPAVQWVPPAEGCITKDTDNLFQPGQTLLSLYALEDMPPYYRALWGSYPPQRFSTLLRTWLAEGKDITVVEDSTGMWTISVKVNMQFTTKEGPVCFEFLFRFSYDTTRGGVVTGVRLSAPDERGEFTIENGRVEIDLQEVRGGFWMPETIKDVYPWDKRMTVTSYDAVEVNPPVKADVFRLEFPKGVYVDDYVNKLFYVEGGATDQQSASRDFACRHRFENSED